MSRKKEVLLSVKHLKKYFNVGRGSVLKAVDDVSFDIYKGETLGMVGESGCGKTTCGRVCIGLYGKTDGQVLYRGKDVHAITGKDRHAFKKDVQMVFQDPYGSLDPRMTVAEIIAEGLDIHHIAKTTHDRQERIYELLELVGLNREHANRFVHEFSGGQRQRIGIARALAVDLFIAHDLSMVKHISDRVAVLYLGSLVELTTSEELYSHPMHPYTQALLSAIPIPDPDVEQARDEGKIRLEGQVPSPIDPPPGCKFQGRCRYATERCRQEAPALREYGSGHFAACHRCAEEQG